MDENGCRLAINRYETALPHNGEKIAHLLALEHSENVTLVFCASALWKNVPPTIFFNA
jgi:hypothetical protein